MSREIKYNEVGELRPSQFFFSYGVGSIIDLPNYSVLVNGFNESFYKHNESVSEDRLLQFCKTFFRDRNNQLSELKEIPVFIENTNLQAKGHNGIDVSVFPKWFLCTSCHELHHLEELGVEFKGNQFQKDKQMFVHKTCLKKDSNPLMVPVRFCTICENGHLSEFPWMSFVHGSESNICSSPKLTLKDYGRSGNLSDLHITCENCNVSKGLKTAFDEEGRQLIGKCHGEHPQIGIKEECLDDSEAKRPRLAKAVMVGASNTWFSVVFSSLYLSDDDLLREIIPKYWKDFSLVTSKDHLIQAKPFIIDKVEELSTYSVDEIWSAIERRKNEIANPQINDNSSATTLDLKKPEWDHFAKINPKKETNEMIAALETIPSKYNPYFSKLIRFHRIRETKAYLGFTRLESPREFGEGENLVRSRLGRISEETIPSYIPAMVNYGEGIFIQFRMEKIMQWLRNSNLESHIHDFIQAESQWKQMLGIDEGSNLRPWQEKAIFLLVHSFSHIWMRQIAMESGYAQASIRERLYVNYSESTDDFMAGVLIYTASSDSDGTLGGLVRLGRTDNLERILDQAFEEAKLCSTDPLCSSHSPTGEGAIPTLSGAACYACSLAPETSCEFSNKWLDRSVIVPTLESDERAYFEF